MTAAAAVKVGSVGRNCFGAATPVLWLDLCQPRVSLDDVADWEKRQIWEELFRWKLILFADLKVVFLGGFSQFENQHFVRRIWQQTYFWSGTHSISVG